MTLLAALAFAYAGFSALCAVARRSQRLLWRKAPTPPIAIGLRAAGYVLIAVSWFPCLRIWGTWQMATAAWGCLISVAALLFVWPFTYAPRVTVLSGGAAAVIALILSLAVAAP